MKSSLIKNKILIAGFIALFLFFVFLQLLPATALAQNAYDAAQQGLDLTAQKAGVNTETTVSQIIGYIINVVMGFLGVIFLILVIVGGFQWMTAGGAEETIKKAKQRIVEAVIGLAVILFAFVLTNFVIFKVLGIVL